MSAEKQRRINRWRSGNGVCYVCGTCLQAPAPYQPSDDAPVIAEVCNIRLCLLRYGALADYEEAHVLDNYTFLKGRRDASTTFEKELGLYYDSHIKALNPIAFEKFKVALPSIFGAAVVNMQRSVADCTVPACLACNKAMVKTYDHTMAVYKSFNVTANCASAEMEGHTNKANNARKVIQQIALYFEHTADGDWIAKPPHKILTDSALWRCMAFLNLWRAGQGQRMRLIAMFYASFYIYHTVGGGEYRFEEWHTKIWRPFCMKTFKSGSFLGFTYMPSPISERVVFARLTDIATRVALIMLDDQPASTSMTSAVDEKTLMRALCGTNGTRFGTERLFQFLEYNFNPLAGLHRLKDALAAQRLL